LCGIYTYDRRHKDLGCDPATINADTVIIFDIVPHGPGRDLIAPSGGVAVDVRIAHQGPDPIVGTLCWTWDGQQTPVGQAPTTVRPYDITEPYALRCDLPAGSSTGCLLVWVTDAADQRRASGFLDITTVREEGRASHTEREEGTFTFSERDLSHMTGTRA